MTEFQKKNQHLKNIRYVTIFDPYTRTGARVEVNIKKKGHDQLNYMCWEMVEDFIKPTNGHGENLEEDIVW